MVCCAACTPCGPDKIAFGTAAGGSEHSTLLYRVLFLNLLVAFAPGTLSDTCSHVPRSNIEWSNVLVVVAGKKEVGKDPGKSVVVDHHVDVSFWFHYFPFSSATLPRLV